MLKRFEHFFIIPIRWYKRHYLNWINLRQRCKVCGNRDKFNFYIDDDVWKRVIPNKFQNRVVCLACFDDFAKEKEIDYTTSLKSLSFTGEDVVLFFNHK